MRRRDFITLIGTAAVWPAAAIALQNNKKWLIGIITVFNDKEMTPAYAAFRARLRELGWVEGQNVAFDVRATSGDYTKLDTEAGSLIAASADVIVAQGTASLAATKRYTKTIPVVFNQVSDPVGQRLIDSLAPPGGNVTGLTNFEFASASKWIELLLELNRRISQVMLITNPQRKYRAICKCDCSSRGYQEGCGSRCFDPRCGRRPGRNRELQQTIRRRSHHLSRWPADKQS